MINRQLRILRGFCRTTNLTQRGDLRMRVENIQMVEDWKKAERTTTLITYGKYGLLGLSVASIPIFGLSGVNTLMVGTSIGLLSFDRSLTKYLKQYAIQKVIEKNMINLDIQK
jgi:hypothetical protein